MIDSSSNPANKPESDKLHSLMQNLLRVPGAVRTFERVPLGVQVGTRGATSSVYVGSTENISDGGLFVATTEPRPVGDHFPVEFTMPNAGSPVNCVVEVMWVRAKEPELRAGEVAGMGLKFVAIDAQDQARVAAFVAATALK